MGLRTLLFTAFLLAGQFLQKSPAQEIRPHEAARDAISGNDPSAFDRPLPLSRGGTSGSASPDASTPSKSTASSGLTSGFAVALMAVGVVFGLYIFRKKWGINQALPVDLIQVLGQMPLDHRETLRLVKCGSRVLVLTSSAQFGLRLLTEISDPQEVDQIVSHCVSRQPACNSMTSSSQANPTSVPSAPYLPVPMSTNPKPSRSFGLEAKDE